MVNAELLLVEPSNGSDIAVKLCAEAKLLGDLVCENKAIIAQTGGLRAPDPRMSSGEENDGDSTQIPDTGTAAILKEGHITFLNGDKGTIGGDLGLLAARIRTTMKVDVTCNDHADEPRLAPVDEEEEEVEEDDRGESDSDNNQLDSDDDDDESDNQLDEQSGHQIDETDDQSECSDDYDTIQSIEEGLGIASDKPHNERKRSAPAEDEIDDENNEDGHEEMRRTKKVKTSSESATVDEPMGPGDGPEDEPTPETSTGDRGWLSNALDIASREIGKLPFRGRAPGR